MAFVDGNGLSAADVAAVTGNGSGFGSFGGDGAKTELEREEIRKEIRRIRSEM